MSLRRRVMGQGSGGLGVYEFDVELSAPASSGNFYNLLPGRYKLVIYGFKN